MVRSSLLLKVSCYPTIYQTSFINAGKREWLFTVTLLANLEGQIALIYDATPFCDLPVTYSAFCPLPERKGRAKERGSKRESKSEPTNREACSCVRERPLRQYQKGWQSTERAVSKSPPSRSNTTGVAPINLVSRFIHFLWSRRRAHSTLFMA